ncbi:DUF6895 family protein [Levilactobacillus fujinensis]|uniref:DUF6895 family protein n=1 Tax=Levilactobacillus fujinensis TaxID=2486024 RepID=A0ABW1TDJ6_9LACO|nr:hypothetical protein [Levilactobacillus fujinensis]
MELERSRIPFGLLEASVDDWINNHRRLFLLNKKSTLEYYIMQVFCLNRASIGSYADLLYESLFTRGIDKSLSNKELHEYVISQTETDYEQIELLAIYDLKNQTDHSQYIQVLIRRGLMNYLASVPSENAVLGNRDFIYEITHTIFWGSSFGWKKNLLKSSVDTVQLEHLLDLCLSTSLMDNDIDVLLEVLVGYVLCDLDSELNSHILKVCMTRLAKSYDSETGHIIFETKGDSFATSYHSTLVLRILLGQYLKSQQNKSCN